MAEEEDFSALPLTEQFTHKNWKARKGGYETAAKQFKTAQPIDPIVRDFTVDSNLWKGAVSDSNVAAQQEALNAYNAYLDAAGADGARKTRGVTVQGVVEKGLTGRPAAKASALESLLLLIELDKADPVIEELLPFLSHKQPKIIAATLSALTSIYHAYGCKVVEPKPVVKQLPKAFGHADKNVRAEAQNLTVELYRWLREAMKPLFWGELKEVQQKDLDKLFEPIKAEPPPKQERLLRSQQAAKEQAEATGAGGDGGEGEGEEGDGGGDIDLEPEYEAVDVLSKVPKDFGERLASSKWKDRKEALDDLFNVVNVPAMQEGPFDDILRGCAKSMKDANIAVVTVAANCVECIAKGLKKAFTKYRGTILAPMLERLKEKKVSVTDAIGAACDAVFTATGFAEIQGDVLEALQSKNPQVKEHTAKFLVRCLKSTREAPTLEQTKEFAEASKKLLTESVAPIRDAGAEVLGVLWKIMGDRNMLNHLEGLDDIRKNKIKEFSDAAEVRTKWKPKAAAPPPKAAGGAPPSAKKPALGNRRAAPAGVKKAPPAKPVSPPPAEEAPLQPRPSSKPTVKPPGGLRPPGAGLRVPGSGLQKPATGLKGPSPATSSPKRQSMVFDDPPPAVSAPPKPNLPAPGRGLAGRPLGKPPTSTAAPSSPPPAPRSYDASSALSTIERQELSDLRAECELLRSQTSDLRQDKLRLTSQIAELQNQNAQLIEDHTRDVLQIRAKETQLVRARSDAENAEERANSLSREIDRLKRELSRLGRREVVSPTADFAPHAYGAAAAANGDARPTYGTSRSYNVPSARAYGDVNSTLNGVSGGAAAGIEGKENIPESGYANLHHPLGAGGAKLNNPALPSAPHYRPTSNMSSGRATPLSNESGGAESHHAFSNGVASGSGERSSLDRTQSDITTLSSTTTGAGVGGGGGGGGGGVESWRRAAEVTQNLKARIEMMKARQNIGRGS